MTVVFMEGTQMVRKLALVGAMGLVMAVAVVDTASAEVTGVTITSRRTVAGGHTFGNTGAYEKLTGRISFALDPRLAQNRAIADLELAPRTSDGKVHFSSDLFILRPVDLARGNGVLLFELANRGNKLLLTSFNRAEPSQDPEALAHFGDGLLMREGYTLVWVGWQFDVPSDRVRLEAPPARLPAGSDTATIDVDVVVDSRVGETAISDDPVRPGVVYPPADTSSAADRLTVRDLFWEPPTEIPRERWSFVMDASGRPRLRLAGGFEPGRWYRISYRATGAVVAGAGLAAIRDAASAFKYGSTVDVPVRGRVAYAMGQSQTGRFLREFLYGGFNADEKGRRTFDAVWAHIAGAARGSFNERFATPSLGDAFRATRPPFSDDQHAGPDGRRGGLLERYGPDTRPKVFYTQTSVEYWGLGRAAALTHVSADGARDLTLHDDVRIYLLAGTQHGAADFPPVRVAPSTTVPPMRRTNGEQLSNPTPHDNVMRALLRSLNAWVTANEPPPPSRYPTLRDGSLVPVARVRFPTLTGVSDPRRITGPARLVDGRVVPLPFLVPQVDADGNETAGIRDPEVAVPLATVTGWNFRSESVGNTKDIYPLTGSYIPFALTRAERLARFDPRLSIEERYRGLDDYLQRVRAAATRLIEARLMLEEDLAPALERARAHWRHATTSAP
jgi:hypothetical protein